MTPELWSTLEHIRDNNCGFLSSEDVAKLAQLDRTRQLRVRFGACRLTAAAQNVHHIITCMEAGGDYVRDVSLLASDTIYSHQNRNKAASRVRRVDESHITGVLGADGVCYSDADPGL